MIKYCKDCRYFKPQKDYPECLHPAVVEISPVTGEDEQKFCNVERKFGKCGPEGALFKPSAAYADYLALLREESKQDREPKCGSHEQEFDKECGARE